MTELSEKLKEDLLEKIFYETLDTTWIKRKPDFDLDLDNVEIMIEPANAEKVNEIEYFTVVKNVMSGTVQTDYIRKPT